MTEPRPPTANQDLNLLNKIEGVGSSPLLTIQTVFPFRFFPCVVKLDREKITIADHFFFFTREVEDLLIRDVVSITTTENLLFASVMLISGMRLNRKLIIPFFWKEDARKLRRLCEGLRIALKEDIDVMKISDQELISRLDEIGSANI